MNSGTMGQEREQPQPEAFYSGDIPNPLHRAAVEYVERGLSVIPTDPATKAPVISWKEYQTRLPTREELEKWFVRKGFKGLGIVCGSISGALEILDFDCQAKLFDEWQKLVEDEAPGLTARLVMQKTQRGGLHAAYRCPAERIPGNAKLAQEKDGDLLKTLIETRGEGGQFLAAPSLGYELVQGDFQHIPHVSADERRVMIKAALALNQIIDPSQTEGTGTRRPKGTERPGDAFNETGEVAALLEKYGWMQVRSTGNYQYWRRPGKDKGLSASLIEGKILWVFSTNAHPFEAGKAYSPFAVYTLLEHNGDYIAASRTLFQQGYGKSRATCDAWPEPEPIRRTPEPPEPFPVEALGELLGPAALAMHEIIKAPLAVCGQSVLATANLAVQGHADVIIDGRSIPLSEFFLSISLSGDRKSAADRCALSPVESHQKILLEEYQERLNRFKKEFTLWKADHDEALRKKDSRARREAMATLPPAPNPPFYPQLTTEEPTYEGLTKLLFGGWPSIGLFSDEGGRFFGGYAMSQDHRLKTLAGLSDLWDGRPLTRTRSGEGAIILYGRRCCAHFLMQPLVAETILGDPLAHDQGFLSRCLIVAPESTLGDQSYSGRNITEELILKRYFSRLSQILGDRLPLKIDPLTNEPTNELTPRLLPLSHEAKAVWVRFHDWVQSHLHHDGIFRPISGIAAKAAEHALRLAGTLTLVDDLNAPSIAIDHTKNGIILARFYLTEALRMLNAAKTNPDLISAEKVLTWLRTREGGERMLVSLPEVYQFGPNVVRDKATALKIMQILADHGWLRPVEGGAKLGGKYRRQVWEVHHHVFQSA